MWWIISESSIEYVNEKMMYFAELHASQWLSCRILKTPALKIFECNMLQKVS